MAKMENLVFTSTGKNYQALAKFFLNANIVDSISLEKMVSTLISIVSINSGDLDSISRITPIQCFIKSIISKLSIR